MSRWLQEKATNLLAGKTGRRSFMVKSAVVGSALAANPLEYVLKPGTAYAAICNCGNLGCDCGGACCDGWTEFCCTIGFGNGCPGGTIPGGWWKADGTSFCGGAARYYIDCNVAPGYNPCSCGCGNGNCGNRRACCNQFRYGQCHQEIPVVGAIMCRVVTCTPPWILDPTCTLDAMTDNRTGFHDAACLHTAPPPPPPPPPPKPIVHSSVHIVGDWDGDGKDGIGIFRNGWWYLRNATTSGFADISFPYGNPGDIPVVGDWNGDGKDGIGVVQGNQWRLRNSATGGPAEIAFGYGNPGDIPVVGDWNGDGKDGIGVIQGGNQWRLRNTATGGFGEINFMYGNPGDHPIVGDWDGDGKDGVGVIQRGDQWRLRNSTTAGFGEINFQYGNPGDTPLAGDWDGNGADGIGVNQAGALWRLRNSTTGGFGEINFQYGDPSDYETKP